MKRLNNLFDRICSTENLELADRKARKRKGGRREVREFDKDREGNIERLRVELVAGTYKTPEYVVFKVWDPKERDVYMLPYRDRIVHHAIMNVLEGVFVAMFTADSYSCIKRKGVHAAGRAVKRALSAIRQAHDSADGSTRLTMTNVGYWLQLDIKKFYPSVNHVVLKGLLRRKFKDVRLLRLLDEIIDSAPGLPIGNYLSQYLANFYLTGMDHWLKEVMCVKYYFRYADDMVILHEDKAHLHGLRVAIGEYLRRELKLEMKGNYQVFPVSEGLDFVGYVFYPEYTRVRKRIKQACKMAVKRARGSTRLTMTGGASFDKLPPRRTGTMTNAVLASYMGWFKHGDCKHLSKKLFREKVQRTEYSKI